MFLVQVGGGVELLREELVDDGGHDLRGVEVQVVAARQLAVHEVRVVLAEDLAEPRVHLGSSASKSSIQRFVITEKAPTRAFSWLKAATTAFTFKTLC